MHIEHWGEPAAAHRVLLLHGLTSSALTWWQIGEGLAANGWSVTAPDLRGHGSSPRDGPFTFAALADDVLALGASWDLVVGHSLGGAIAITALFREPGLAARAVLIDPVVWMDPRSTEALLSETLASMAHPDPAQVAVEHPGWHSRTIAARVSSFLEADPAAVTSMLRDNQRWDLVAQASALTVPVHVLAADPVHEDAAFPAELGERLAAANPRWTYEIVPGASHSVHRDQPAVVLAQLM